MKKQLPILFAFLLCALHAVAQNLPTPKLVKTFSRQKGNTLSLSYKGLYYFNYFGELWSSDGTTAGTIGVKTINPGDTTATSISALRVINNQIFMVADDGIHGRELWISDGTANGTQMVTDLNPNGDGLFTQYSDHAFAELNGNIFFYGSDGVNGIQLWKSDGTAAGTQIVKIINPTGDIIGPGAITTTSDIVSTGKRLFFRANDGVTGDEPWVSDGTANNTHIVADIAPKGSSGAYNFMPFGDKVLFAAFDTFYIFSDDVYITDGTAAGTYPLLVQRDFTSLDHIVFNGKFYFFTNTNPPADFWETDGTINGTKKIKTSGYYGAPSSFTSHNTTHLTLYNNSIYFCGSGDSLHWNGFKGIGISNGTQSGTTFIDMYSIYHNYNPMHFTQFGGLLYFMARDTNLALNIWRTDGNNLDEIKYSQVDYKINALFDVFYLTKTSLTVAGNQLFYWNRYNAAEGFALYKIDMFPDAITDVNTHTTARLYPNPASDVLHLQAGNAVSMDIYSISGSKVQSVTISGKNPVINISNLTPAMYTATVTFKDGSRQNLKFVKQ